MADFDYMGYNRRKRAAGSTYGAKTAQNAYAQFLSQQRGSRKKFDFQNQTEKLAPKLVTSFSQRGLAGPGVKSGIYERGLTDFAKDRFQGMADINREQDEEMQQLQLEDRQTRAEYDQQIAELEAQKQAAIAQAAATLSAFKPFLGG
jgi:hypothetical protein